MLRKTLKFFRKQANAAAESRFVNALRETLKALIMLPFMLVTVAALFGLLLTAGVDIGCIATIWLAQTTIDILNDLI
jgi:hypothetical protein